mmetsp:Transcript_10256/g.33889  ORF Transcript_10256/g.33889 Transcript_10256/m.33889 type:complete len:551 (+) Transcript_10256:107-1759(+)
MMDDPENEFMIKRIRFHDIGTCMLMQNENGPCPLLALSNVLFLRGALTPPHPDLPKIHISELTAMLAEYMLETNQPSETDAELRANQQQNLQDGMSLFPKLQRGLDVNVKFNAVDAFEYSEDLLLFDLLNVRLLHGWLLDPQDRATCAAVGNLTYNQVVERIIEYQSPSSGNEQQAEAPSGAPTAMMGEPVQPAAAQVHPKPEHQQEDEEFQRALALSMVVDGTAMAAPPAQSSPSPSPPADRGDQLTDTGTGAAALGEGVPATRTEGEAPSGSESALSFDPFPTVPGSAAGDAPVAKKEPPSRPDDTVAAPSSRSRSTETIIREGLLLQEWLQGSASQLSYHGLERLHAELSESELCVFFRNNHFATLTKHAGELYLLVTDLGYAREPLIVWERLNQIDGDSTLCTSSFDRVDESQTATATEALSAAAFEVQFAEAEAARAAEASRAGGFGGEGYPGAGACTADEAGYFAADRVDADMALAMQLQREEEAMLQRVETREREQQQQAQGDAQARRDGEDRHGREMLPAQAQRQGRPRTQPAPRGGGCVVQ